MFSGSGLFYAQLQVICKIAEFFCSTAAVFARLPINTTVKSAQKQRYGVMA